MQKGLILGGGLGTRLRPLTNACNKHSVPIAGRAMIEYPIARLVSEGITEICVCTNGLYGHQLEEIVGDGARLGCKVNHLFTGNPVNGPGRTLQGAEDWARGGGDIVVLFGDGIFFSPLGFASKCAPHMYLMDLPPGGADDPSKYAQARVEGEFVRALVEKPPELVSTLVQAGAFIFPQDVFAVLREIGRVTPADREVGITEINQWYAARGALTYSLLDAGDYIDCGTHEALREAAEKVERLRASGPSIF